MPPICIHRWIHMGCVCSRREHVHGKFLTVSVNIQLHTMNLSINNGIVKPRNFISYHKDFTALGDTGKSIGNDDILIQNILARKQPEVAILNFYLCSNFSKLQSKSGYRSSVICCQNSANNNPNQVIRQSFAVRIVGIPSGFQLQKQNKTKIQDCRLVSQTIIQFDNMVIVTTLYYRI